MEPSKDKTRLEAFVLTKEAKELETQRDFEGAVTRLTELVDKLHLLEECWLFPHFYKSKKKC